MRSWVSVALAVAVASCGADRRGQSWVAWRADLAVLRALDGEAVDGTRDVLIVGYLERQTQVTARVAVGPRAVPLFVFDDSLPDPILGGGAGVAVRLYPGTARGPDGPHLVFGLAAVWHDRLLPDNDSLVNFLSEVGVAYAWESGLQLSLGVHHISNGGFKHPNGGCNLAGLTLGWVF